MSAFWLKVAAFSGASAVLLGAFGAHGLKNRAGIDAAQLKTWETAAHYHLVHSAALLFAAYTRSRPAALLFTAGILLFSGSLYALVLTGHKKLGAITPVGGLALTAGWLALVPWNNFTVDK